MQQKISIIVRNYWWYFCQLLLLTSKVELDFGEDQHLFQTFKHMVEFLKIFRGFESKYYTTVDCRCGWSRHECPSCWTTSGVNCNKRPYCCICPENFICSLKPRFRLFGGAKKDHVHEFLEMMVHQFSLMATDYTSGLENTLLYLGVKYDHWGILELALNRGVICSLYTDKLVSKCLRGNENPLIISKEKIDLSNELSRKTYMSYLSQYSDSLLTPGLSDKILEWSEKYNKTLLMFVYDIIGVKDIARLVLEFMFMK